VPRAGFAQVPADTSLSQIAPGAEISPEADISSARAGPSAKISPKADTSLTQAGTSAEITPKADTTLSQAAVSEGTVQGRPVEPSYRVILRSLLYPGWGQLYNGQYLKALAVFTTEATLLSMIYTESRQASKAYADHLATHDPAVADRLYLEYSRHFDRRDSLIWWTTGLVLFSLADAYVDSHLITFEEEFGEPQEKTKISLTGGGFRNGGFVGLKYLF